MLLFGVFIVNLQRLSSFECEELREFNSRSRERRRAVRSEGEEVETEKRSRKQREAREDLKNKIKSEWEMKQPASFNDA